MFSFDFEEADSPASYRSNTVGSTGLYSEDEGDMETDDKINYAATTSNLIDQQQTVNILSYSNPSTPPPVDIVLPSSLPATPEEHSSTLATSSPVVLDRKVTKADFELLKVIGKGAYGKVFMVRKFTGSDAGTLYAMKVLRKAHLTVHSKDAQHTMSERSILQELRHPFIVRLFYAFQTDHKLYLILDYVPGGELFTYLERDKMFLEDVAVFYLAELVLALEWLHSLGIVYRDLKPENILLDNDGHIRLTDFGLSKVALDQDEKTNTVCGTVDYMAPEVLANIPYDKRCDWWSLGALAYDMMTGSPPFAASNRKKTMDAIMHKKLTLPYFLTQDAKDLLTKLIRKNAQTRLGNDGTDQIKSHRFFKSIKWNDLLERKCRAPIVPVIQHPEDVNNFHPNFTSLPVEDSPITESINVPREIARAKQEVDADIFNGFSFVASCVLTDRFEDLYLQNNRKNH